MFRNFNVRKLNTRRWSTPLIMSAGLFSATTGLLMFFVVVAPFKMAHELVGVAFSAAILLHILSNFKPFRKYFTQRLGAGVIVLALAAAIGLLLLTMNDRSDEARALILERVENAPVSVVATLVGMEPQELADRLRENGVEADDLEMSLQELAARHGADTEDILYPILKE